MNYSCWLLNILSIPFHLNSIFCLFLSSSVPTTPDTVRELPRQVQGVTSGDHYHQVLGIATKAEVRYMIFPRREPWCTGVEGGGSEQVPIVLRGIKCSFLPPNTTRQQTTDSVWLVTRPAQVVHWADCGTGNVYWYQQHGSSSRTWLGHCNITYVSGHTASADEEAGDNKQLII